MSQKTLDDIDFLFTAFGEYFKKKMNMDEELLKKFDTLCHNFKDFLQEKNRRYGDSAINPIQIFSKIEPDNQICNRLDDKLSRLKNSSEIRKNDLADFFGYTALLLIKKNWITFEDLLD